MISQEKARGFMVTGLALAYIIVASVLVLWAAGALFFILHRAQPLGVSPTTWLTYSHFYWHIIHQRQLLLISIVIPSLIALIVLGLIIGALSGAERALHGAARFAQASDVAKVGLMGCEGIIVGKYQGKFLQFPGQQFCLLAAPTRSGKGVSFVIPNLLNWPDSCVVLDIKLENFRLTSGFRARHGQKVFLFNPYAEDYQTHRWNPLDGISRDVNFRVGDLLTLAGSLYPARLGDKDAFWQESAKNLFLGLSLMVMESEELPFTLGEILRQASGRGAGLKAYLTERINARIKSNALYSSDCVGAINRFLSASENTLANIISSFTAPLTSFANPLVDAATSVSDFDLGMLRDEKMTIYIGIQPNRLADASLLINVLFSQLINVNTKELSSANRHPHQCLLILDEFTALGKIGIIAKANAFIAGYNLRLLTIIQSIAQLEAVYGQHDARTLITNHAMQVLFAPREQKDANAYSEMLGYYTVKSASTGRSVNRGFGSGGTSSENISDQRRALLLPQELKSLSDNDQIIILENTLPIQCEKAKYYKERAFMDRLKAISPSLAAIKSLPTKAQLDQVAWGQVIGESLIELGVKNREHGELSIFIPCLDVDGHVARVEQRLRPLGSDEDIDLTRLDLDSGALPVIVTQVNPGDAEIEHLVDCFFGMAGVETQSIASMIADPTQPTQNALVET